MYAQEPDGMWDPWETFHNVLQKHVARRQKCWQWSGVYSGEIMQFHLFTEAPRKQCLFFFFFSHFSHITLFVQRMSHITFAQKVRIILMRFCPRKPAQSLSELRWRGDQALAATGFGHLCRELTVGGKGDRGQWWRIGDTCSWTLLGRLFEKSIKKTIPLLRHCPLLWVLTPWEATRDSSTRMNGSSSQSTGNFSSTSRLY